MARARRRSRAPAGRTERRSRRGHHPAGTAGKVRADAPRDTRRTGYSPIKETIFALPPSGEYGGAGGVEGSSPLTPCPAPGRRPAAHAGQQPQDKEEQNQRQARKPPSHPMPRAGQATRRPCRAAAARQGRTKPTTGKKTSLSPHAPRRAGDPPPVPGSSRHTEQAGREKKKRKK